jgi:outer membrane protein OmpA-like peptidoglycan-associated protein
MSDAHARRIDTDGLDGVVFGAQHREVPERQQRLVDPDGLDGVCSRDNGGRSPSPAQERAARMGIFVIGTPRPTPVEHVVEVTPAPPHPPPWRRGAEITTPTVMFEASVPGPDVDMHPTEIGSWSVPAAAVVEMQPEDQESVSEVVALTPGLAGLMWAEVQHEQTEIVLPRSRDLAVPQTPEGDSRSSTSSLGARLDFSLQPFSEQERSRPRSKASAMLVFGAAVFATGAAGGAAAAAVFLVVALSWLAPPPQGLEPTVPQAPVQAPAQVPVQEILPASPQPPSPALAPALLPGELTLTDAFSFAAVDNDTEGPSNAFVQLATELGRCPGQVILTGHTCSLGPEEANLAVGLQRAASVRDQLVRAGLPAERIEIRTEGSRFPIARNDTEEGRRRNRRVTALCNELTTE